MGRRSLAFLKVRAVSVSIQNKCDILQNIWTGAMTAKAFPNLSQAWSDVLHKTWLFFTKIQDRKTVQSQAFSLNKKQTAIQT